MFPGGANSTAAAASASEGGALFSAYVTNFYVLHGNHGWFKKTQTNGVADFWELAEEIETVIDAHEASCPGADSALISQLLNGFIWKNGTNWADNIYNDDCMWASIAFSRGYLNTGNERYRTIARWNFDMVYARAWDDVLGGGFYWSTANRSKNSCVNGPAGIAASLLAQIYHEPGYQTKALAFYDWERTHLFNLTNGAVADSQETNGTVHAWASTYNQGTFIGLANYLGQTNDAALAADFTRDHLTRRGLLLGYGLAGNNSGFNAIFLRWMVRFMNDRGLQSRYLPWLQDNANAAWQVRRPLDGLSWCEWLRPTPPFRRLYSWDCVSSLEAVALLGVTSPAVPNDTTSLTNSSGLPQVK